MDLLSEIAEFLIVCFITYGLTVACYFVFALALLAIIHFFPERRIQKHRDGMKRARRDIKQSLWGMISTAFFFGAAMYIQLNELGLFEQAELTWISAPLWFIGILIVYDTWFYWQHRLMHTPMFYRYHQVHHRSVATTVWSSESFHWVDDGTVKVFFTLAAFLTPVPMEVLIALRVFDMGKSTFGHCGHELTASPLARTPLPLVCNSFHDKHHSHFRINFANTFTIWDRICGTIDPDYDQQVIDWEAYGKEAESQQQG